MLFSKEHEWIVVEGDIATIGITSYAADQLGDIVYVDLPAEGASFKAHDPFAVAESVKAASDVYIPVSGVVIEINSNLEDSPDLVNTDAEAEGWFVRVRIEDPSQLEGLMSKEEYEQFIK
jgi:glycine cleavage system H protein